MSLEMRDAPHVRLADVHHGDTLKRIALRELGDASLWVELALINGLKPPYLVPLESAGPGLLAYGDRIKIPAPGVGIPAGVDADAAYGRDLLVQQGRLQVTSGGDLALASGLANLSQSLMRCVMVKKRELGFHPSFGCWVRALVGGGVGPNTARMAAFYVQSALLEDYRVQSVASCVGTASGDKIRVEAVVIPVSGEPQTLFWWV